MYPNPLVADLLASGIANQIARLHEYHLEPNADVRTALAQLEQELDHLAAAVGESIEFLEGRDLRPPDAARE